MSAVSLFLFLILVMFWRKNKEHKETISDSIYRYTSKTRLKTWFFLAFYAYATVIMYSLLFILYDDLTFPPRDPLIIAGSIFVLSLPLLMALNVWINEWLFKDMKRRGINTNFWTFIIFSGKYLFLISLVSYLFLRRKHPVKYTIKTKPVAFNSLILPSIVWVVCAASFGTVVYLLLYWGIKACTIPKC